eukprot:g8996.t1
MLTEAEILHYWSTLKRKIDFSQSKIRQIRRSSGWVAYVFVASAMEKNMKNSRFRTLQGSYDLDAVCAALQRAEPRYLLTRPRFLTVLHEIFDFNIAASIYGESRKLEDESLAFRQLPGEEGVLFLDDADAQEALEDMDGVGGHGEDDAGSDSTWSTSSATETCTEADLMGAESSVGLRDQHLVDRKLLMAANALYSGFDLDGANKLNWRAMVCRMRVILFPESTPSECYMYAFYCYTEDKRRTAKSDPHLSVDAACAIFSLFVGSEGAEREINRIAQIAYKNMPDVLKRTVNDIPVITRGIFLELMATEPLKPLFEEMPGFRRGVFLYAIEYEYYHRAVKQKLRRIRKTKRIRGLLLPYADRFKAVNTVICMKAFKIIAVRHAAGLWIQRVWRGHHYGRERARERRLQIFMAIRLQTMWRKRMAWEKLMARIRTKNRKATAIQKVARGFLARIIFRQKLLEHYIKIRAQIEAERRMLKVRQMNNGAVLIQSVVRGRIIGHRLLEERKLEVKAEVLAREMDRQKESEENRFLRLYQQQIQDYWKNQKKEYDEQVDRLDKFFKKNETDSKDSEEERLMESRWAAWELEWQQKATKAAEAEESRIIGLIEGRGGRSQRDQDDSKEAKKFVSDFVFDIMKRFRDAGVNISRSDAKEKAYEAVKKKYNERMRGEVADAQVADKLQILADKQKEAEALQREAMKIERETKKKAAITLQSHWRARMARGELKKRLVRFFKKKFSVQHFVYYYEHRVSEIQFWEKPKIFGMLFDLALPKNWYYFDDKESKQHYYAQPCSGKVKWSMPEKCVPCEQHPLRFAIFYCQDCGIMLCDECNTGNLSMKKTIHLEHNKLNIVPGIPLEIPDVACSACNMLPPEGRCRECNCLYCESCFRVYHENPEWPDYYGHQMDDLL